MENEHYGWRLARIALSMLMLVVALPAYLHTHQHEAPPWPVAAATTTVRHWETPCLFRERTARGIPAYSVDETKGYMRWYRDNWGTPAWHNWNTAATTCERNEPVDKWDTSRMVLANVERVP